MTVFWLINISTGTNKNKSQPPKRSDAVSGERDNLHSWAKSNILEQDGVAIPDFREN